MRSICRIDAGPSTVPPVPCAEESAMGLNVRAAPELVNSRTVQSGPDAKEVPSCKVTISFEFSRWTRVELPRSWHCPHSGGKCLGRKVIVLLTYRYDSACCAVLYLTSYLRVPTSPLSEITLPELIAPSSIYCLGLLKSMRLMPHSCRVGGTLPQWRQISRPCKCRNLPLVSF